MNGEEKISFAVISFIVLSFISVFSLVIYETNLEKEDFKKTQFQITQNNQTFEAYGCKISQGIGNNGCAYCEKSITICGIYTIRQK